MKYGYSIKVQFDESTRKKIVKKSERDERSIAFTIRKMVEQYIANNPSEFEIED